MCNKTICFIKLFINIFITDYLNILQEKFIKRSEPNQRGHPTKLLSFPDAIELIMVLPGNVARETRKNFVDILNRYLAGAPSLIREIQANALSDSPIAQLARGGDDGSSLVNHVVEQPNLELISVELKKGNENVVTAVTTSCTQIKEEIEHIGDSLDKVVDTVMTVVENSKEVATLTALAKAAERKAKRSEHISYQVRGEAGAEAAKKYKRLRKELVEEKKKVGLLTRQNADFLKRIQKLEEIIEDVFAEQIEINASQDELKAGQSKILGLLVSMQPVGECGV